MSAPARPVRPGRGGGPGGAGDARGGRGGRSGGDPRHEGLAARLADWTSRPLFDYTLLLGVTFLLAGIGLIMVLSSSMADAGAAGNVWGTFLRQAAMAAVGLLGMWVALRLRISTIRRLATPALLLSLVLLVLVLIIGVGLETTGAQSWLDVGPVSIQPSELAKLALALWGSKVVADKLRTATSIVELFGLLAVGAVVVLGLVLVQRDLGMTASIMVVVAALAWFAGLPRHVLVWIIGLGAAVVAVATAVEGFRSARISVFVDTLMGRFPETQGAGYQSYQGLLSLADGSFLGVGLGQSRAKWFYLPEAKNDFIFAIIGEELGFMGAALVILLYALLGWVGLRISAKQADPFLRLLAGTLTAATVVQAFINIGYVVGLLPVTGLQLPLISAGGTSIVVTLMTMGLLATCARHEPEAVSAMRNNGMPRPDFWFRLREPEPYDPAAADRRRPAESRRPRRFGPPVTAVDEGSDRLDDGRGGIRDFAPADDGRHERHDRDRRYHRDDEPPARRRGSRTRGTGASRGVREFRDPRDDAPRGPRGGDAGRPSRGAAGEPRVGRGRYGERGRGGGRRPDGRRR
ncbi:putative lipid II flippase FtsW [Corynebacterium sp.]|uniref:putative lipid II flippase FtsW n=1 Tax=Corynebacterium sp. TaxID=1720 RepID=UPI0026DB04EC|nr:putative lipid II flippase FtsW [Corynebacterium sp.]MDO4609125.1 putative lipid II flippase FtsW [Corynebacterium sp.]